MPFQQTFVLHISAWALFHTRTHTVYSSKCHFTVLLSTMALTCFHWYRHHNHPTHSRQLSEFVWHLFFMSQHRLLKCRGGFSRDFWSSIPCIRDCWRDFYGVNPNPVIFSWTSDITTAVGYHSPDGTFMCSYLILAISDKHSACEGIVGFIKHYDEL